MLPFHGKYSKIKTISQKIKVKFFTKTQANMAQSVDEGHLQCFHSTANHKKSRLLCTEIKIRFDYSRMRIWPNIG